MKYCFLWDNVNRPVGVVQIIIDIDEIPQQYDGFARFLNRGGYIVYANSMCSKNKLADLILQENQTTNKLHSQFKCPIYVFGNGIGAIVARHLVNKSGLTYAGICVSCPCPQSKIRITSTFIMKWIFRKKKPDLQFDVARYMISDECRKCPVRPMLVIGGCDDMRTLNTKLSDSVYNAYRMQDIHNLTMIIYPDLKNVNPCKIGWTQIQNDVLEFLAQHRPSAPLKYEPCSCPIHAV